MGGDDRETGQLGPPYGQLGPLFKDNSDHFPRTTRTNI
jgi:hypothetical protein